MKAFSSIKREFKALYKPRAADSRGREKGAPFELEDASRSGTAGSWRTYDSNYTDVNRDDSFNTAPEYQRHVLRPTDSAEKVAATVEDILAGNRMSLDRSGGSPAQPSEDAAKIELPTSPASGTQGEQFGEHEEPATELQEGEQEEEEEAQVLTFEEAQAIRNEAYITFDCEEADDYTQGPARFILGTDGVQQCAALLMTFELSEKIQKALRKQHAFEQAEMAGMRQRHAFMRFENQIEAEVANCRTKIAIARDADPDKEGELQQQLEILALLLDDVQSRRQTVNVHLDTQAEELRDAQAAANALIQEAYIRAYLMEQDQEEPAYIPEELDLEAEYAAFCEQLRSVHDTGMVAAASL